MIAKLQYISQQDAYGNPIPSIRVALEAGCKLIQLRIKNQSLDVVIRYAEKAKSMCEAHQAKLIINDFPEAAAAVGAFGVHLGLNDMPVEKAKQILPKEIIIGGTANTFDDISRRAAEGVDYIGLGPYRFTKTKENLSPVLGLPGYKQLLNQMHKAQINLPIYAIGGIAADDVSTLMQTGIYGVAVSGVISFAKNPKAVVNNINKQLILNH